MENVHLFIVCFNSSFDVLQQQQQEVSEVAAAGACVHLVVEEGVEAFLPQSGESHSLAALTLDIMHHVCSISAIFDSV